MTTTKNHNEALLNKIDELKSKLEIANLCIEGVKEENDPVKEWHEVEAWSLELQIETLKEAIINQELKNW